MNSRGVGGRARHASRHCETVHKRCVSMAAYTPPGLLPVPVSVLSDSYKATHFKQYPACKKMIAYGEFRCGYDKDPDDLRIVNYGMRYLVDNFLHRQWTQQDVDLAGQFYATHCAGGTALPWPQDLFQRIVDEHDGYFPVKLQALREGSCSHVHVPVYQISAAGDFAPLCTFLETILTQIWYPCTVATLSRRVRDVLEDAFSKACDGGADSPLLLSRLHDFGMRGCTSVDQAIIGGCAHLLSFDGTDTMAAAFYAQFNLNNGKPVGFSIPATEHSVMTAWPTERTAILNMIDNFGDGLFACVMDSYDYVRALEEILPTVKTQQVGRGGYMILRPDSGDPVVAVLQALRAADKVFGSEKNSRGYKVINGCGVIQGDGINATSLRQICDAVIDAGYSPESVAYGMGGGLLQKCNRDTMSFATKLSHITYADGVQRDVMKRPKTDLTKFSLPGELAVMRVDGVPTIFPSHEVPASENMLEVVYDCGPVDYRWETFDEVRARIQREWSSLPRSYDPISTSLRAKMDSIRAEDAEFAL